MENTLKTISKYIQPTVYILLLIAAAGFYIYTLGYSTNWAYIVSETRAARFYLASQTANRTLSQVGFAGVILLLLLIFSGSFNRKTFFFSNIVLSILSSIILMVSAIMTLYYNSVLEPMYRAITELEVPPHLYQVRNTTKSYLVFEFGNMFSIFMIIVSILLMVFIVYKIRVQKDRAQLIQKVVKSYEQN
ncbi:hypothetical protein N7603_05095 [Acholeplasma vituli]|uniref:Uncharacterized protein n=1 Tax=Paracholeplasma vituli TaxID=69473 RepID=A0ABT2PVR1_9MOLU|nr:hypothetical protein [Paracholeplasma vituli]MCU0105027.1 hypothetical protein [Paracholeplasma vituli]